ncbi:MAG: hypothetical protein HY000_17180, partial [Planctomycetes bacterium]|nr:hypothetical protein [Planctomycetota bacterium]
IGDADQRDKGGRERNAAQAAMNRAEQGVEIARKAVAYQSANFEATAPYQLVDDTIAIRPIQWADASQ